MAVNADKFLDDCAPQVACSAFREQSHNSRTSSQVFKKVKQRGVRFSLIVSEVWPGEGFARNASELLAEASSAVRTQALRLIEEAAAQSAETGRWRQAETPDGRVYYINARTRKLVWERPKVLAAPTFSVHGLCVGELVEVWNTAQEVWCAGFIERLTQNSIYAAFQMPGEKSSEWY